MLGWRSAALSFALTRTGAVHWGVPPRRVLVRISQLSGSVPGGGGSPAGGVRPVQSGSGSWRLSCHAMTVSPFFAVAMEGKIDAGYRGERVSCGVPGSTDLPGA